MYYIVDRANAPGARLKVLGLLIARYIVTLAGEVNN